MRIAVACMANETNGFNPYFTEINDFETACGAEVFSHPFWTKKSQLTGIFDILQKNDVEIIPLYFARTIPSGTVSEKAYNIITDNILSELKKHSHIDAICWALHGSFYAENVDDPEGQLLAKAHNIMPDIPFHVGLDTHAKISPILTRHASSISIYKTSPHEDYFETGQQTASIAVDSLKNNYQTFVANIYVPMLLSGEISMSSFEPTLSLVQKLYEFEKEDYILSANLAFSFPWIDSPLLGCNAVITGKVEQMQEVHEKAQQLASLLWEKRGDFTYAMEVLPLHDAIHLAKNHQGDKPVIISDLGDNVTAGASSDKVDFLAGLLENNVKDCLFAAIYDKKAFEDCAQKSIGENIELSLGCYAEEPLKKLEITAKIKQFYTYENQECCLLKINDLWLILAKGRVACADTSVISATNIPIKSLKSIIIKCGYHGKDLVDMADKNILALTKGDTTPELSSIPYKRIIRPIYPLDPKMEF